MRLEIILLLRKLSILITLKSIIIHYVNSYSLPIFLCYCFHLLISGIYLASIFSFLNSIFIAFCSVLILFFWDKVLRFQVLKTIFFLFFSFAVFLYYSCLNGLFHQNVVATSHKQCNHSVLC